MFSSRLGSLHQHTWTEETKGRLGRGRRRAAGQSQQWLKQPRRELWNQDHPWELSHDGAKGRSLNTLCWSVWEGSMILNERAPLAEVVSNRGWQWVAGNINPLLMGGLGSSWPCPPLDSWALSLVQATYSFISEVGLHSFCITSFYLTPA